MCLITRVYGNVTIILCQGPCECETDSLSLSLSLFLSSPPLTQSQGPKLSSYLAKGAHMLDVRTEGEYKSNTAKGATNLPLANLNSLLSALDR